MPGFYRCLAGFEELDDTTVRVVIVADGSAPRADGVKSVCPYELVDWQHPCVLAIELLRAGSGHSHDLELRREVDHVHIRW